mgnify:CR=1 FL=1
MPAQAAVGRIPVDQQRTGGRLGAGNAVGAFARRLHRQLRALRPHGGQQLLGRLHGHRACGQAVKTRAKQALRLHRALDLGVYSRADFILDEEGNFWCLEINTLPGMTPTSLVPQEAAQVGLSYGDLCQRIVDESLALRKGGRA